MNTTTTVPVPAEKSAAISDSNSEPAPPPNNNQPLDRHVCPYCGLAGARPEGPCPRCTIQDTPQTRQATRARIGPWYVLQQRNPAAPGMKWSTLLALVKKGQVTPRSVVRGPTTHQLWRFASQVKGLSREFGICYSCGVDIDRTTTQCPHCDRLQEPPANPDQLLEARDVTRQVAALQTQAMTTPAPATPENALAVLGKADTRTDGGILSARELAAAFQLDFKPAAEVIEQAPAQPAEARPRRFGRAVLVMLILSLLGGGAYVWFTPEYRQAVVGWYESGKTLATQQIESWRADRPQEESTAAAVSTSTKPQPPPDMPQPRDDASRAAPLNAPSEVKVTPDPNASLRTVRKLWSDAIDAEVRGDWNAAVNAYEQIHQLPQDLWPGGLQRRLDDAKAHIR